MSVALDPLHILIITFSSPIVIFKFCCLYIGLLARKLTCNLIFNSTLHLSFHIFWPFSKAVLLYQHVFQNKVHCLYSRSRNATLGNVQKRQGILFRRATFDCTNRSKAGLYIRFPVPEKCRTPMRPCHSIL